MSSSVGCVTEKPASSTPRSSAQPVIACVVLYTLSFGVSAIVSRDLLKGSHA